MALISVRGLQSEIFVPVTPPIVWTRVHKALPDMTVALVTAGGVHLKSEPRFHLSGDSSYRLIPADAKSEELMVSHGGYDNTDANRDINSMFPLDRLRELVSEGFIKRAASSHIGFMGGGGDVQALATVTGPAITRQLRAEAVDAVVMTAG